MPRHYSTRGLPRALTFALFVPVLFARAATPYTDAVIRSGPSPGLRLSSGLVICDEELYNGRWVNRYWTSTGQIKPDVHLEGKSQRRAGLPQDAFQLGMEGQNLSGTWKWISADQQHVENPDGLLVTVTLQSTARPVTVKLHTLLHGGPVMVRWLEITNTGNKPTAITSVSPWSGIVWEMTGYQERIQSPSEPPFEVATTRYKDWGQEAAWGFTPLANDTKTVVGDRGRSGWGHPTFFARNRASGEWFVCSLAWSGNWTMHVTGVEDEHNDLARLWFDIGPSAVDPVLRVLAPGETVKSPEAHILLMHSDLDAVIQQLHTHVRNFVLPQGRRKDYDIEANHRGYIVDHESEAGFKREVDIAASVGAEEFVIDAGWYGPDPNVWNQNVGDWYAGSWLPHDLNPVREYARQKGMRFGLWVEIESVGAASKLRQQHPDWILTRNGQPVAKGRQLDFANPAVVKWAQSEIERIIRKYDLDLFRIDYNTAAFEGGNRVQDGFLENTQWRHVQALYSMFDHLRKEFPNVIFQNCASGGGRLDYGIMQRFDNTEMSDWMRAPRVLKILNGTTWVLPPEVLLLTFGTETAGLESDGDLDTQLTHTMLGLPIFRGISPSLPELNPLLDARIREDVELFKKTLRPTMIGSRVFHHTLLTPLMSPSPWVVLEYAAPDGTKATVGVFRTSQSGDPVYHFTPRGLDLSRSYSVHFQDSNQVFQISGDRLKQEGLPIRLDENLTSEMLTFQAK